MTQSLIEAVEELKLYPVAEELDAASYHAGIDDALMLIRKHEAAAQGVPGGGNSDGLGRI